MPKFEVSMTVEIGCIREVIAADEDEAIDIVEDMIADEKGEGWGCCLSRVSVKEI